MATQQTINEQTHKIGDPQNGQPEKSDNNNITHISKKPNTIDNSNNLSVWYCSSRWLMAHHDPLANINTTSSHLVLADLHQDNEHSLAIIDFKRNATNQHNLSSDELINSHTASYNYDPPYESKLIVYRGLHLVYSHFLNDIPSSLVVTSCRTTGKSYSGSGSNVKHSINNLNNNNNNTNNNNNNMTMSSHMESNLVLSINDDIYFYKYLKPSQRISLEDYPQILDSMQKSEVEAWQMAKLQDHKVDLGTLRELLSSLRDALGPHELSSHANNFLALSSEEERRRYLLAWRLKRLDCSNSEQLMSMDTICCSASRRGYPFNSNWSSKSVNPDDKTSSNLSDLNNRRQQLSSVNKWYSSVPADAAGGDSQDQGLVIGTEDRHVLVYNLTLRPATMERHYRLPATPDHIIIESRSPSSYTLFSKDESYGILVSCRNCFIYRIIVSSSDNNGTRPKDASKNKDPKNNQQSLGFRELVSLKCQVVQMCWADGEIERTKSGTCHPNFVVATLDRRLSCFGSYSGDCKWLVNLESPITTIISLPPATIVGHDMNLIGVASQANRVDFYTSSTGLIVDSIFFNNDYPQAMIFGRFGREDNCLLLTTKLGHLLIFILKRAAKFAHGQCLSSANSYATDALERLNNHNNCNKDSLLNPKQTNNLNDLSSLINAQPIPANIINGRTGKNNTTPFGQQTPVPSSFNLTKDTGLIKEPSSSGISSLTLSSSVVMSSKTGDELDHDCERVQHQQHPKRRADRKQAIGGANTQDRGLTLDGALMGPRMSLPVKSRHFVDHIVQQRAHSKEYGQLFAKHLINLSNKLTTNLSVNVLQEEVNWIKVLKVLGLGNSYRVSLSLSLHVQSLAGSSSGSSHLLSACSSGSFWLMLFIGKKQRQCRLKPFKFDLTPELKREFQLKIGPNSKNSHNPKVDEKRDQNQVNKESKEEVVKEGGYTTDTNRDVNVENPGSKKSGSRFEKTIEFRMELNTNSFNSMGTLLSQQQMESISLDAVCCYLKDNHDNEQQEKGEPQPQPRSTSQSPRLEKIEKDSHLSANYHTNRPQRILFIKNLNIATC